MNLLQLFFIVTGFMVVLIWYDFLKKRRLTKFQIFILICAGILLIVFTLYPSTLHYFWKLFWVDRWAYVIVYLSIIFLAYMLIYLLAKFDTNKEEFTKLVRELALLEFKKEHEKN